MPTPFFIFLVYLECSNESIVPRTTCERLNSTVP